MSDSPESTIKLPVNEVFISVDIEADGPVPGENDYSMVSLGACVVDNPEYTFYEEIRPISPKWKPDALAVSGFTREQTLGFAHPFHVMGSFADWLDHIFEQRTFLYGGKWVIKPRLVMVGFNAPFDWMFVNWYMHHFVGRNPLGISALDIKALYMGSTRCHWSETSMARLPDGLKPAEGLTHNALDDARDQASIFQNVLILP